MRVAVTFFAQNATDWDRYEAAERHESDAPQSYPDARVYQDELRLGRQVEPLGFDGLWTVEHHFTPYTMVTNPLQFLTYFAGCTERIDLGTMVIVLPWHNPLRVAEDLTMLDHMIGDRRLVVGFGRGAARREFNGFDVPMGESRQMFLEHLDVVRRALTGERFSYEGAYFTCPELELRPRPRDPQKLLESMYMAWGSPSSVSVAAETGLKPLIIPQKGWDDYGPEMTEFETLRGQAGYEPARPIPVVWAYCDETEEKAREGAIRYMGEYGDTATRHYEFLSDHFDRTPGYEYYAEMQKARMQMQGDFAEMFVANHVWGTPDQCVGKVRHICAGLGAEEIVLVVKYGSMPVEAAEKSMRLFAEEALPAIHELPAPELVGV